MPEISVISNTSPLFYLHQVDCLEVLRPLYGTVYYPEAVRLELEGAVIVERVRNESGNVNPNARDERFEDVAAAEVWAEAWTSKLHLPIKIKMTDSRDEVGHFYAAPHPLYLGQSKTCCKGVPNEPASTVADRLPLRALR